MARPRTAIGTFGEIRYSPTPVRFTVYRRVAPGRFGKPETWLEVMVVNGDRDVTDVRPLAADVLGYRCELCGGCHDGHGGELCADARD